MMFLDTQIVSYALKGRNDLQVRGKAISAITANELLMVQSSNPVQANYYVPILSKTYSSALAGVGHSMNRDHPFHKMVTDQVILEFGNEYPTVIEFGNLAISMLINQRVVPLFFETIKFLDKEQRKTIRKRYEFLLENEITCVPLTKEFISVGMQLLQEFTKTHSLKANFRNSLNDMLILSTAISSSGCLFTEDSLLNRFASNRYSGGLSRNGNLVTVDFSKKQASSSRAGLESKGYVNRGWQVKFRKYGNS